MKRSVALIVLAVVAAFVGAWAFGERRRDSIDRSEITADSIVMLGDSITSQGDWSALLPGVEVVNEGHPGFTTEQLRKVGERVASRSPRTVFVLAGTNDVRDGLSAATTIEGLSAILAVFAERSPDTRIVMQTITPRAETAQAIIETNDAIVTLAEQRGIELLDLHAQFDAGDGGLRPAETTDGWHLSSAGYERWVELLEGMITAAG